MKPIYLMMILAFGITNAQIRTTSQSLNNSTPKDDLNFVPPFQPYDGTYAWPDVSKTLTLEMMVGEEVYISGTSYSFSTKMPSSFDEANSSIFQMKNDPNERDIKGNYYIITDYKFYHSGNAKNRFDYGEAVHVIEMTYKENGKHKLYYLQKGQLDMDARIIIPVKYFQYLSDKFIGQNIYVRKDKLLDMKSKYATFSSDDEKFKIVDITVHDEPYGIATMENLINYIVEDSDGQRARITSFFNEPHRFDLYEFDGDLAEIRGKAIVPTIYTEKGYKDLVSRFGEEGATRILNQKIKVGMSIEELIRSWGVPKSINRSSYGSDQWVYDGSQYVYTEDGKVTDWN